MPKGLARQTSERHLQYRHLRNRRLQQQKLTHQRGLSHNDALTAGPLPPLLYPRQRLLRPLLPHLEIE